MYACNVCKYRFLTSCDKESDQELTQAFILWHAVSGYFFSTDFELQVQSLCMALPV